jgi:hypothetical protein
MKKLLLATTSVLALSFGVSAWAGSGNNLTVDSTGDANHAAQDVTGSNNDPVSILQVGDSNTSTQTLGNPTGPLGYTTADNGSATGVQKGNHNTLTQFQNQTYSGSGNDASAVQRGDGNTAYSEQNQGSNNKAVQRQDSRGAAAGNNASIFQYTSDDTARQDQAGGGNYAAAVQTAYTTAGHNRSSQDQAGTANSAATYQYGDHNHADVNQGTASAQATGDYSLVGQTGTGNRATQNQNQTYAGGSNVADSRQTGYHNETWTDQNQGSANWTYQVQTGNGNYAESQQYVSSDKVYQTQVGNRNNAVAVETAGTSAGGNTITQTTYGNRNSADARIYGGGNVISELQGVSGNSANDNYAVSYIAGDANTITISQNTLLPGGSNKATADIFSGNNNNLSISQQGVANVATQTVH